MLASHRAVEGFGMWLVSAVKEPSQKCTQQGIFDVCQYSCVKDVIDGQTLSHIIVMLTAEELSKQTKIA